MSTRKIKLSQKLTLRFRDVSMPDANAVADLLNEDPDPNSSAETFDSLPDLLPFIFQSQTEPPAPDAIYFVSDCSTYKLWETCATDVIPLASQNEETEHWPPDVVQTRGTSQTFDSQNEEAERWLSTDTQTRDANHSESSDDANKSLKTYDRESVNEMTKNGVRENLRRVQAFSPLTSILFVEKDHNLGGLPVREIAHDGMACDTTEEFGRDPNPFDIDADTNEMDSYLILEDDAAKEFLCDVPSDANETAEKPRPSSENKVPDGIENVEKRTDDKRQSTRRRTVNQVSDFPQEYRKQKRSTPRRREQPPVSIHLVRKLNWLSDTEHDHVGGDQGEQVTATIVDIKEKTINRTRKTRKSVPVASVATISSKSPPSQPRSRRGRKKNPIRSSASLNGEE